MVSSIFKEYPCGISEHDIQTATTAEIGNIVGNYSYQFLRVIKDVLASKGNNMFDSQYKKYQNYYISANNILSKWDSKSTNYEDYSILSVLIGTLLEGSLQFFLLAFLEDYNNREWNNIQINNDQKIEIINSLKVAIDNLREDNVIGKEISSKIMRKIKTEIYKLTKPVNVEDLRLGELIQLFENEEIFDREKDSILFDSMKKIRDDRNNVHIFCKNPISTTDEVRELSREYCFIIKNLLFRIRCIDPDERRIAYIESFMENQNTIMIEIDENSRIGNCVIRID